MRKNKRLKVTTRPEDLVEGLFGQVILLIFEILPYLDKKSIIPEWEIRSKLYGDPDLDYIVIPGLLVPRNQEVMRGSALECVTLPQLRDWATVTLGNDWHYLNAIWSKYFLISDRIIGRANLFPELGSALGLHFRGTDKNKAVVETNYVSEDDFLAVVDDFTSAHPEVRKIFLASDENGFFQKLRNCYPDFEIIESGPVVHHKDVHGGNGYAKGEHALLDCLLLSRCKYLLKCQSALSGFAKVLNPDLEAYRISANKLVPWAKEIPYFPDAFLPRYESERYGCRQVIERLFVDDWTQNAKVARIYGPMFRYKRRRGHTRLHSVLRRVRRRLF